MRLRHEDGGRVDDPPRQEHRRGVPGGLALGARHRNRARGRGEQMCEDRRRAAWHEAGHTVMALIHGRLVNSVTLTDTDLDRTEINRILSATDPLSLADEEFCVQELKIGLAGYAGEVV